MVNPVFCQEEEQRDRWFNPYRRPASAAAHGIVAEVLDQLESYEQRKGLRKRRRKPKDQQVFEDTVAAIVSDLIYNHLRDPEQRVAITRSNKVLGTCPRYRAPVYGKPLRYILDSLSPSGLGFLDQQLGRSRYDQEGSAQRTAIKAAHRLVQRAVEAGLELRDFTTVDHPEAIVLKRTKEDFWDEGGLKEYPDTAKTEQFRLEMAAINDWLREAEIDFDELVGHRAAKADPNDRFLRRIFTQGRFDSGGRLFGGFWQDLGKRERLEAMWINGEQVVELDYGQVGPRIVYGMAGADLPAGDLYHVPALNGLFRAGIKKLFNAMLFATAPLTRKPKGTAKLLPKQYSAEELCQFIAEAHPAIKAAFFTGVGHDVQHVESQIMVKVLLQLREKGVVALPIHDALIVARGDADAAGVVMKATFLDVAGVEAVVTRAGG